ncbi:MAG: transglycosylase domain-containing protein [Anaerolineae bacterium]|nr:transglycosylase domain-containing protein [Anaerolineae bacterium]
MLTSKRLRAVLLVLVILATASLAAGRSLFGDLPTPTLANLNASRPSTLITDRNGRLLYEAIGDASKNIPLAFDQIPAACWQATVAVEDSRFFQHPGVDLLAIGRAAWLNWRGGGIVSGASTLTQQLARNTLMSEDERFEQSLRRKLREAWLAVQIELRYTKSEILALYLNQVYYGNFATGLEAAAQSYFGKSAQELDLAECSLLAGLLQNQIAYNPLNHPEAARLRQSTVLNLMVLNGYTDRRMAELALAEQLQFAASPFTVEAPHFVSYVEAQMERLLGVETVAAGGLKVVTTLDLNWQTEAERTVRWHLQRLENEPGAPAERRIENAAVLALDPQSGAIRTMVGSPDYFDAAIQGAMNGALALRQPGSAIKPITYALAMDPANAAAAGRQPLTAATVINDVRTSFLTAEGEPYVPENYDRAWHGPVSARVALASSYNLPAVKVLQSISIDGLINQARRQGITSFRPASQDDPNPYGLALTLGGGEVSLLELTAAYGAFANGGWFVEPYAIERIEDRDGVVLFQAPTMSSKTRVLDERVAYLVTDILSDDDARSPSFGHNSVLKLSRPAAVKTGTTTDWRDNWTVGYTPDLVAGVWVGNANNAPMLGVSGVTGAGPIWHDFMQMTFKDLPAAPFRQPPGMARAEVCIDSGLLPTQWCQRRRSELFIAGTEPTTYDAIYQPAAFDTCLGVPASASSEAVCIEQQVRRVYPPELRDWARANGIEQPQTVALATSDVIASADNRPVTGLALVSPDPNSAFQWVDGLAADVQQIRLAAQPAGRPTAVAFMVDGQEVAVVTRAPYEAWWTLEPGTHRISARSTEADGTTASSDDIWIEVDASPGR